MTLLFLGCATAVPAPTLVAERDTSTPPVQNCTTCHTDTPQEVKDRDDRTVKFQKAKADCAAKCKKECDPTWQVDSFGLRTHGHCEQDPEECQTQCLVTPQ
jgi:hypothetical protein